MSIDFHAKPFDDGTVVKLSLYEDYLGEWLSVFMSSSCDEVHIYNFFAGPGSDARGRSGSPLITFAALKPYLLTERPHPRVKVFLNELKKKRVALEKAIHWLASWFVRDRILVTSIRKGV